MGWWYQATIQVRESKDEYNTQCRGNEFACNRDQRGWNKVVDHQDKESHCSDYRVRGKEKSVPSNSEDCMRGHINVFAENQKGFIHNTDLIELLIEGIFIMKERKERQILVWFEEEKE